MDSKEENTVAQNALDGVAMSLPFELMMMIFKLAARSSPITASSLCRVSRWAFSLIEPFIMPSLAILSRSAKKYSTGGLSFTSVDGRVFFKDVTIHPLDGPFGKGRALNYTSSLFCEPNLFGHVLANFVIRVLPGLRRLAIPFDNAISLSAARMIKELFFLGYMDWYTLTRTGGSKDTLSPSFSSVTHLRFDALHGPSREMDLRLFPALTHLGVVLELGIWSTGNVTDDELAIWLGLMFANAATLQVILLLVRDNGHFDRNWNAAGWLVNALGRRRVWRLAICARGEDDWKGWEELGREGRTIWEVASGLHSPPRSLSPLFLKKRKKKAAQLVS